MLDVVVDQATFEQMIRDLAVDAPGHDVPGRGVPGRAVPTATAPRSGCRVEPGAWGDLAQADTVIERRAEPRWWRCETPDGDTVWLDPDGSWHTDRPDGTEIT